MSTSILDNTQINADQGGDVITFPKNVDAPAPPTSELVHHTRHINSIDPQVYNQNIFKGDYVWSTSDVAGSLLTTFDLHPDEHPFLQYYSKMYHMWKGDFTVLFRIMGTAFQAGLLAVVALPPDVDPATLGEDRAWTAYNWQSLDVKCQEAVELHVPDINQGMFHYTDDKRELGNYIRIGGKVAVYVDSPLNTTASGTPRVSFRIWLKPHKNFKFSYLRIPKEASVGLGVPAELEYALDFSGYNKRLMASCNRYAGNLTVLDKAVKTSTWTLMNHYKINGERYGTFWDAHANQTLTRAQYEPGSFSKTSVASFGTIQIQKGVTLMNCLGTSQTVTPIMLASQAFTQAEGQYLGKGEMRIYCNESQWEYIKSGGASMRLSGTYRVGTKSGGAVEDLDNLITLPVEESFVVFESYGEPKIWSSQTVLLASLFETKRLDEWLPPGQCAVFRLIDKVENLPVAFIKLWPEGVMSTKPSDSIIRYNLTRMKMVFENFVPRNTTPRSSGEISRNGLLVASAHRKIAKKLAIEE